MADGSVLEGVLELLARFAYSLDDRAPAVTGSCFTDRSTLQLGPAIGLTGRSRIQEFFARSGARRPLHHFAVPHIEQTSATTARAQSNFFTFNPGQGEIVALGQHVDEVAQLEGAWFVLHKDVTFFYESEPFRRRLVALQSELG